MDLVETRPGLLELLHRGTIEKSVLTIEPPSLGNVPVEPQVRRTMTCQNRAGKGRLSTLPRAGNESHLAIKRRVLDKRLEPAVEHTTFFDKYHK
jgi:hypothetical protein